MFTRKAEAAFTIVELLIVVVVIAVLATISIVSYIGIQERANESALKSDLAQATKQLSIDKVLTGNFPNSDGDGSVEGVELPAGNGTSYEYSVDNTVSPPTFCLSGTSKGLSYSVTESGSLQGGVCPGHSGSGDETVVARCSDYSVGDDGPAGGIIFHKAGNTCYEAALAGWYSATAPSDPQAEWGCYGVAIPGADGLSVGAGRQNTSDVLAAGCSPYTSGRLIAAVIASDYNGGGMSDWYLPSQAELSQMGAQRNAIGWSGFSSSHYWSSTESSNNSSYVVYFIANPVQVQAKSTIRYVRPIRHFSD